MVNDKDPLKILQYLPKNAKIIATQANIARSLPKEEFAKQFRAFGFDVVTKSSVAEALEHATQMADNNDLIFVGGSTFIVAEIPFEKFPAIN